MGEIDRINPIIRPILGPRGTDRVQPGTERHHQHHEDRKDNLDLTNVENLDDVADPIEPAPEEPEHGLDLSI